MEKDGPQTRRQGLCKHEDAVLTRYSSLVQGLKWRRTQVGAERGAWSHVHARPWGRQVSICCDWSLGDGGTGTLGNTSVALEQLNTSLQ